jgi:hypothetical protein
MNGTSGMIRTAALLCLASDQDFKAHTPALAAADARFAAVWMEHIGDNGTLRMAEHDTANAWRITTIPLDLSGGIPAIAFNGSAYGLSDRSTPGEYRFVVVGRDGSTSGGVALPYDACLGSPLV